MKCSACGQDIPRDSRVVVDLEDNSLVVDSQMVRLTNSEAELLYVLSNRIGRTVLRDTLMSAVYTISADAPETTKILDVLICHIRKKIAKLNVRIETVWGRGYRLEYGNPGL